jgi:hypothetical protein
VLSLASYNTPRSYSTLSRLCPVNTSRSWLAPSQPRRIQPWRTLRLMFALLPLRPPPPSANGSHLTSKRTTAAAISSSKVLPSSVILTGFSGAGGLCTIRTRSPRASPCSTTHTWRAIISRTPVTRTCLDSTQTRDGHSARSA